MSPSRENAFRRNKDPSHILAHIPVIVRSTEYRGTDLHISLRGYNMIRYGICGVIRLECQATDYVQDSFLFPVYWVPLLA